MRSETGEGATPLFEDRNFRWLLAGAAVSMLGDQFTLIALPWLVLKMTGDTFALGATLALIGVPRAVCILFGGALTDRYSPRRVLMLTKYLNFTLLSLLALLVYTATLELWMVYGLALVIGVSTAFSIPSSTALLPHAVKEACLPAANSVMLAARQITIFAGPPLAGLLIASLGDGDPRAAGGASGLGSAFLFDACTFAASALTLERIAVRWQATSAQLTAQPGMLAAVIEGLRHCWRDRSLRTCLLYWAAIGFFISGPMQIAIPAVALQLHSATAFGILLGAHGAGSLAGMIASGFKSTLRIGSLGTTILTVDCLIGVLFIAMGNAQTMWQGALPLLLIGVLGGFLHVAAFTWMQRRIPAIMMGRAMSIFMFVFVGIAPLSAALAGWLMRSVTAGQLFAGSGLLLIGIVLVALFASPMRQVSDFPARPEPNAG